MKHQGHGHGQGQGQIKARVRPGQGQGKARARPGQDQGKVQARWSRQGKIKIKVRSTFSQFVHCLFKTCSQLVQTCSRPDHILFTSCSQAVHNLHLIQNLFMTCSQLFTIFSGLFHNLQSYEFTNSYKLNRLFGLSLSQLSPRLMQLINMLQGTAVTQLHYLKN